MFAIRVKQLMPEIVCRRFRCPYRANPLFLIVTQGGARGRACPGLISVPPSGERDGRDTR